MPIDLRKKPASATLPPNKIVATNDKNLTPEEKAKLEEKFSKIMEEEEKAVEVTNLAGVDDQLKSIIDPGLLSLMEFNSKQTVKEEVKPIEDVKQEEVSAGGAESATNCPHCGWLLSKGEDEEPDRHDKLSFLQSLLGQIRWLKSYEFLDGKMSVVFRTLTTEEADMAFTQVAYDANAGKILEENQYFRTLTDYRLAMSIESIRTDTQITHIPEVLSDDFKVDIPPKGSTKLAMIVPWFYENILKTEALRRVIGSTFFRFQRLVEKLEVRTSDSDFWKATGEQSY